MPRRVVRGPGLMGSIANVKKSLKSNKGANSHIKIIGAEQTFSVRFLTEPDKWHGYYEHYDKQDGFFPCWGGDCCTDAESRATLRYLANVWSQDDNKVMALKMPKTLAEDLMRRYDRYTTMQDRWYDMGRTGTGQMDTKYSADPDSPSKWRPKREPQLLDLGKILDQMANPDDSDDDEDEEETPRRRSSSGRPSKSSSRRVLDEDDDYEDDEDDDEDEDEPPRRSRSSRPVKRATSAPVKRTTSKPAAVKRTITKRSR